MSATEVLSIVLTTSADFLDEGTLGSLLSICSRTCLKGELNGFFLQRCTERQFVNRLHEFAGESVIGQVNWMALFRLNVPGDDLTDCNVYIVHCGEFLFSIPQKGSEVVVSMIEELSLVISFPFDLHHMTSDGLVGSLCRIGESGSRFVVVPRSLALTCTKSRLPLKKLRSSSLDVFRYPKNFVVPRGRTLLRSTALILPRCLPALFRSQSSGRKTISIATMSKKILDTYFLLPEDDQASTSSLFLFTNEPILFDISLIRMKKKEILRSEIGLFSMFRDLIDLPSSETSSLAVFQRLASRMAELTLWPSSGLLMDAFNVNRVQAVAELSRVLEAEQVENYLKLADSQWVSDRPLLVQLSQSDWARFKGLSFALSAHSLGPTLDPQLAPPLPENHTAAVARLTAEFTRPRMSLETWTIRINLVAFKAPIFFGNKDSPPCTSPSVLTLRNCQEGFRQMANGVWVTSWKGILLSDESLTVAIARSATGADLKLAVAKQLELRHGICLNLKSELSTTCLSLPPIFWCAGERLDLTIENSGEFFLQRKRKFEKRRSDPKPFQEEDSMLWDTVHGEWASDKTRQQLALWASRESENGGTSPVSLRKRFMEGIRDGTEQGIDPLTEYSRYWDPDEVLSESSDTVERDSSVWSPGLEHSAPVLTHAVQEAVIRPNSPITKRLSLRAAPRKLRCSKDTRQFEFHPFDDRKLLLGSRSGVVSVVDSELDFCLAQVRVDYSPILALAWFRSHANLALYGGSASGIVGVISVAPGSLSHQPVGRFANLSSVTVNCSDDYFAVSGFARDVAVFDTFTGTRISELKEAHSNFINIVRFSNFSPHLFATSSFDCTCKLWDLRTAPIPVAVHTSPNLNVMGTFSPEDDFLLLSGLDAAVEQLSVSQGLVPTISPKVPSRNSASNYRRSVYLADGRKFITAGTDEDFVRVIDSRDGESLEVISFGPTQQSYVQSLRGHPTYNDAFGVLLYPFDKAEASFVSIANTN